MRKAFVAVAAHPVFDSGPEVIKPGGERARRAKRVVSIPVEGANLLDTAASSTAGSEAATNGPSGVWSIFTTAVQYPRS
jgi:hypothetical protein